MKSPDLSIIVVSFNTKEITENCLDSIFNSVKNSQIICEIIVVDNDSRDGSQEMLRGMQKKHSNLKLLENKTNEGFGKANNQGVKIATSEHILLLNSDIVVIKDAVESLFEFFKENQEKAHFVGGKLLNRNLSLQPSSGPFYSLPVVFGALFLKGDHWGLTRYSPSYVKEVDWVSGACILTKKEYFQKLKGFDEGIFMYMEEVDLLHRAKKQGYRTFFFPKAQFVHLGSASSQGRTYPILQVYRGFLYLYRKHMSKLQLIILKIMLQLKALLSVAIGRATTNQYLVETYEKALTLLKES